MFAFGGQKRHFEVHIQCRDQRNSFPHLARVLMNQQFNVTRVIQKRETLPVARQEKRMTVERATHKLWQAGPFISINISHFTLKHLHVF